MQFVRSLITCIVIICIFYFISASILILKQIYIIDSLNITLYWLVYIVITFVLAYYIQVGFAAVIADLSDSGIGIFLEMEMEEMDDESRKKRKGKINRPVMLRAILLRYRKFIYNKLKERYKEWKKGLSLKKKRIRQLVQRSRRDLRRALNYGMSIHIWQYLKRNGAHNFIIRELCKFVQKHRVVKLIANYCADRYKIICNSIKSKKL